MSDYSDAIISQITALGFSRPAAENALDEAEGDIRSAQFFALGRKTGATRKIDTLVLLGFPRDQCERAFFAARQDMKEAARTLVGCAPTPAPAPAPAPSPAPSAHTAIIAAASIRPHQAASMGLTIANAKNVLQHYCVTHSLEIPHYGRSGPMGGPFAASIQIGDHVAGSSGVFRRAVDAEQSAAYNACCWLVDNMDDFEVPARLK